MVCTLGLSRIGGSALKPNVLIVAAPFGFGPAARSLIVGEGIKDIADLSFFSDGDAYRFIEKYKPATSSCVKGIFAQTFPSPESLEQFDLFICVNQAPAFEHLGKIGRADRSVFLDSLLRWRTEVAGTAPKGGRAYLAEDYPGAAQYLDKSASQRVRADRAPGLAAHQRFPAGKSTRDRAAPGRYNVTIGTMGDDGASHRNGCDTSGRTCTST